MAESGLPPARSSSPRLILRSLSVLFVISGCTGLLTEQIFEKFLSTLLGSTTHAATAVLASYFAGLSCGAVAYSKLIRNRIRQPLRAYAWLEAGVGLWSLLLYASFDFLIPMFGPVLALGADHNWLLQTLRVIIALLIVFPPTFLMGASFPAVVEAVEGMRLRNPTRAIAWFYSLNLLGAVTAAVLAPYLAFPYLGLDRTLLLCFALDIAVFLAARRLSLMVPRSGGARTVTRFIPEVSAAKVRLLVAVAGLSGFLFFSLEVTWTQLIAATLGNSVYAFAVMLGLVLGGLFAGGFIASTVLENRKHLHPSTPGGFLMLGSLAVLLTLPRWPDVPHAFTTWGANLEFFYQGEILRWIQAFILIFPTSTILGLVFPTLFRLRFFPVGSGEEVAGRMVAANSVASVAGALLTGFVLIPLIGSRSTLVIISLLYALAGLALSLSFQAGRKRIKFLLAGLCIVTIAVLQKPWDLLKLTSGEHVYFHPVKVNAETELLFFHEDSAGGMTTVVRNDSVDNGKKTKSLTLLTNGKFQGNDTGERQAQIGFALIPILCTADLKDALVIGLGTGESARVVRTLGFRNLDVVEIAPGIVTAARGFFSHINENVLEQPDVHLHLEDGRNFLLIHSKQYDLITMEISSIWFAGSTNLYSREFYSLAADRLKEDGVFQQWIQVHHIGIHELVMAIATLRSVFPHVSFWMYGDQGILVATRTPQVFRATALDSLRKAAAHLDTVTQDPGTLLMQVLQSRLLSPEDVSLAFTAASIPLNTDRNRRLEYFTPRYSLDRRPLAAMNRSVLLRSARPRPFAVEESADPEFKQMIRNYGSRNP